jgi:hypothetical protein
MEVTNSKGEKLYQVIDTNSKEFNRPSVYLKTWEEAEEFFNKAIEERDTDTMLVQQITVTRDSQYRLEAQLRCNRKGWGFDYFRCIIVEPALTF